MKNSSLLTNNSRLMNSSLSAMNNSGVSSIMENDDVREKMSSKEVAKLSALSGLNASSSYVSSPSFGRRKQLKTSCMSNGLTHEQLKEIYSSCIRLSSENKINIKNAFGLQLIDYMQDLLTTTNTNNNNNNTNNNNNNTNNNKNNNNGATTNFQVAGCTLDASVKIYSYRVDSVHNDAVKIAGTLGSEQQLPSSSGDDHHSSTLVNADNSTNEDDNGDQQANRKHNRNKKAKRRNNRNLSCKLEKNLKNINLEQFVAKHNDEHRNNNQNNSFNNTVDDGSNNDCFTFGHVDSNPITSLLLNNFGPCSDRGNFTIDPSSCIFSSTKESVWNDINSNCDEASIKSVLTDLYEEDGTYKKINNLIGIVDNFKFMNWKAPGSHDHHQQANNTSILDNINILTGIVDNDSDRSAIEKHRKTLLQSVIVDVTHTMDETLKHDQSGFASDHNDGGGGGDGTHAHYYDNDDFPQQVSAIEFEFPNKTEAVMSSKDNHNNPSVAATAHSELTTNNNTNLMMLSSNNVPMNMTGGLALELSTEPGEYSYFKNLNKVRNNVSQIPNMWAGPEHWKHFSNSVVVRASTTGGASGELSTLDNRGSVISANLNAANKARQPRKRKQLDDNVKFGSNLLGLINEAVDFGEPLSTEAQKSLKTGKASSTFSKNILLATNATSITMLENDPVDVNPLFQLFLMPHIKLSRNFTDKNNGNDDAPPMVTLQNGQIYNYDNDNDRLNYCSGMMDDVSDHKPPPSASLNDNDYFGGYASGFPSPFKPTSRPPAATSIFPEDNNGIFTGAATPMVITGGCISQKNKIDYARFAKRFDTRQIKSTLWDILKHDESAATTTTNTCENAFSPNISSSNDIDPNSQNHQGKTSFDKVYNSLIDQLPAKSAQNVSVPIAIVCLLHLANEKNLSLQGNDSMNNIHIKLNGDKAAT